MQRNLVAILIACAFLVSGCCRTSPWNLTKSDNGGWAQSDLNYVVQQEEMQQNLEKADRIRAEKAALAATENQGSPGILSKVEPLDPADFQSDETQKLIQLVSHEAPENDQGESRTQPKEDRQIAKITPRVSVSENFKQRPSMVDASNPLQPKTANAIPKAKPDSQVMVNAGPPSQLIGHPLRPLSKQETPLANQLQPRFQNSADDSIDLNADIQLEELPPMILAAPPEKPKPFRQLAPMQQKTELASDLKDSDSEKSTEWKSYPPQEGQIQLASWEQEVEQESEGEKQSSQTQDPVVDEPEEEEAPKRDEFTDEDFYLAGWCEKPDCKEACVCPDAKKIAVEVDQVPSILPASFQAEESPSWGVPRLNLELKPLRETPLILPGVTPELPATNQDAPTPLPIPTTEDAESTGGSELVLPVGAIEEMDRIANAVSNADFRKPEPKAPLTWREHLANTIDTIESQLLQTNATNERQQLEGKLELLRLLPSELDETQRQYMNALTDLLQSTARPAETNLYQAGQTLDQLRNAVAYLETIAGMKVVNANFCSKVVGFGQFDLMESRTFQVGQTVLVYCEIENHSSQPKEVEGVTMSSTKLAGSYIVYDAAQNVVQQEKFPAVEDLARQRRRDFYMHLPFVIGDLPPGQYTYQLMIDDVGGGKSASLESALPFTVK